MTVEVASRGVRPLLSAARTRSLVRRTFRHIPKRRERVELSVAFITAPAMARHHAQYRHRRAPTDVLSFRLTAATSSVLLGQVLLCPAVIRSRAREAGESAARTAERLLVHAVLHIIGYDHERDSDFAAMDRLERRILRASSV